MASLYNLEPQPTAKVILKTSNGDLSFELFGKQAPLATRNFLQHCTDSYYDNSIFHRLVPGFIIQGGDPTGTGSGGISAINDGHPFQDEFHSRLKFNRRGLLGMANEGKDSNMSQFFITLEATLELQGKHTMFGRLAEGDTIYNVLRMGDAELGEGSERPLYPTRITGTEILVNPFDDMVARVKEAPRTTTTDTGKKDVKKRKKPAGKNVLSFGGDDGEEEASAPVLKKAKANPKLVTIEVEDSVPLKGSSIPLVPAEKKMKARRRSPSPVEEVALPKSSKPALSRKPEPATEEESEEDDESDRRDTRALDKTNAEIAALKESMKRTANVAPKHEDKPKSTLESMIPATSTRGRKRGQAKDEKGAFDIFKAFKQRLGDIPADDHRATERQGSAGAEAANTENVEPSEPDDTETELCDLHFIANCQSCKSWDNEKPDGDAEADGDDDPGWMAHQLTFAKDTLGKDLEWRRKLEELEVIDPLEKAKAIKEEQRKDRKQRR